MKEKSKLPVFPTISVGINYGKTVDNFEPDLQLITDRMRKGGMDDEQILNTSIHFSDKPNPIKNILLDTVAILRKKRQPQYMVLRTCYLHH